MGTNEVTESLRHNQNPFDLPLKQKETNGTVCSHLVEIFLVLRAYALRQNQRPWQRVPLKWQAIVGAHAADYLQR